MVPMPMGPLSRTTGILCSHCPADGISDLIWYFQLPGREEGTGIKYGAIDRFPSSPKQAEICGR